jgi:hypothetical protein
MKPVDSAARVPRATPPGIYINLALLPLMIVGLALSRAAFPGLTASRVNSTTAEA